MSKIKSYLAMFDDNFAEYNMDEVNNQEYQKVPDGKYQVRINSVRFDVSKNENYMLVWELEIINNQQFLGSYLYKTSLLMTDQNMKWVKSELAICGLHLKKLSDLPDELESLLDITLEVTKKTKATDKDTDFYNIYFNKKLNLKSTKKHDDGDIPF